MASRLWLKTQLETLVDQCKTIATVALQRAEAEALLPLPGYTHMQRAMVSSLGMWWGAWAEAFLDDAERARQARDLHTVMEAASAAFQRRLRLPEV